MKEKRKKQRGINLGEKDYRKTAFENYERECEICNYKEHTEILVIHHADEDRNNNNHSNLQVLCPNCHELIHKKIIIFE